MRSPPSSACGSGRPCLRSPDLAGGASPQVPRHVSSSQRTSKRDAAAWRRLWRSGEAPLLRTPGSETRAARVAPAAASRGTPSRGCQVATREARLLRRALLAIPAIGAAQETFQQEQHATLEAKKTKLVAAVNFARSQEQARDLEVAADASSQEPVIELMPGDSLTFAGLSRALPWASEEDDGAQAPQAKEKVDEKQKEDEVSELISTLAANEDPSPGEAFDGTLNQQEKKEADKDNHEAPRSSESPMPAEVTRALPSTPDKTTSPGEACDALVQKGNQEQQENREEQERLEQGTTNDDGKEAQEKQEVHVKEQMDQAQEEVEVAEQLLLQPLCDDTVAEDSSGSRSSSLHPALLHGPSPIKEEGSANAARTVLLPPGCLTRRRFEAAPTALPADMPVLLRSTPACSPVAAKLASKQQPEQQPGTPGRLLEERVVASAAGGRRRPWLQVATQAGLVAVLAGTVAAELAWHLGPAPPVIS